MTDNDHDKCQGAITVDTLSKSRPVSTNFRKKCVREH